MPSSVRHRLYLILLIVFAMTLCGVAYWNGYHEVGMSASNTIRGERLSAHPRDVTVDLKDTIEVQTKLSSPSVVEPNNDAEIKARPLFSPWRRPPVAKTAPPDRRPVPPARIQVPPRLAKGQITLIGVVIDETRDIALIRTRTEPSVRRAVIGDEIDGWRLSKIAPDGIRLTHSGVEELVKLRGAVLEPSASSGNTPIPSLRSVRRPVVNR